MPDLPREAVEAFKRGWKDFPSIQNYPHKGPWQQHISALQAAAPAIRHQRDEELRERLEKARNYLKAAESLERMASTSEEFVEHGLRSFLEQFYEGIRALDSVFSGEGSGGDGGPAEADKLCFCGHTARWHGDLPPDEPGAGACEHDPRCQCKHFKADREDDDGLPFSPTLKFLPIFEEADDA